MKFPLILLYHRIAVDPINGQLLVVSPSNFEAHLAVLSEQMRVVPLHDIVDEMRRGELRANTIALTFDDGYMDNYTVGLPLIEKFDLHATVFVSSGMVGSDQEFWWDSLERIFIENRNLPERLEIFDGNKSHVWDLTCPKGRLRTHDELSAYLRNQPISAIGPFIKRLFVWAGLPETGRCSHRVLSLKELIALSDSPCIEIGSHTVSHSCLSRLTVEDQQNEIGRSKKELEGMIDREVRYFSYPFGSKSDFTNQSVRIVREVGYQAGIANIQGNVTESGLYAIPRRLVRDWSGETFSKWLKSENKAELEIQTVSSRSRNLTAYMSGNTPGKTDKNILESDPKRKLSIVHINTHDKAGGAAKVAWRLSESYRKEGHQSRMLAGFKNTDSAHTISFPVTVQPDVQAQCRREGKLYYEFEGSHHLVNHSVTKSADIIHLHNLHGGYFNPFSLSGLSLQKPVIWTLHDMQSITGHCAHSFDCEKWKTDCGVCPYLAMECTLAVDTSAQLLKDKKLIYDHSCLQIVTPSEWLKKKVEQSVLKKHPVELIYNGINTKGFRPYNKKKARDKFGIPDESFVVGAVAHVGAFDNPWKGGQYTQAALEGLWQKRENLLFVNIGSSRQSDNPRVVNIPHINEENELAQAYSALDLFLYTPLADNCPLVILEAISCGLPVVTFDIGGIPELVRNGFDGFVVKFRNVVEIVRSVEALIANPGLRDQFGANARKRAISKFDQDGMSHKYMTLYEKCINEHPIRTRDVKPLRLGQVPEIIRTPAFLNSQEQISQKKTDISPKDDFQIRPATKRSKQTLHNAAEHSRLGMSYFKKGYKGKALEHYKAAVAIDADNYLFQKDLADFYYAVLGQVDDALEHYTRALSRDPGNIDILLMLGHISVSLKRFDVASDFYQQVLKNEPENSDARQMFHQIAAGHRTESAELAD